MLNLIMKNAQKQYFWWIGNRTALNKRALIYFYPKTHSDNSSVGFWTEMKPQAKMRSVVSCSPCYSPIFVLTLKAQHTAQAQLPACAATAHRQHSRSSSSRPEALCRTQILVCCLTTPICKHYLGNYLNYEWKKKCSSILQVRVLYPWIFSELLLHQQVTCRKFCSIFW